MKLRLAIAESVALALLVVLLVNFVVLPLPSLVRFAGAAPANWWDTNWNFRKSVTIDHTKVSSDFQSFPLLLDILDADLVGKTKPNGDDVVFVDGNNNKLNHEIESFDSGAGHLIVWVNVPNLSSSIDTQIFMYYGNSAASNQQNPSGVWDTNYVMVQHLEETSLNRFDSTGNGNNGVVVKQVAKAASGKVDGSDEFGGNGYVRVQGGFLPTTAITLEFWVKPYVNTNYGKFLNTGPTTIRGIYGGQQTASGDMWELRMKWNGGATTFGLGNVVSGYNWMHLVLTWNGSYCYAYQNGVKVKEGAASGAADWLGQPLFLGASYVGSQGFSGVVDEVRVSNIARSASWIQTDFKNQNASSTFFTVGTEESLGTSPAPFVSNEDPADGSTGKYTNPQLSVRVSDAGGNKMDVTFRTDASGTWADIITYYSVGNGNYSVIPQVMGNLGTTYHWSVSVTNGAAWTNKTYSFTTTSKVLTPKWTVPHLADGGSGVIIADVNHDGLEEVFHAGRDYVTLLNGVDGSIIWNITKETGWWTQPMMADLRNDGNWEILMPLPNGGLEVLNALDGSTYWKIPGGILGTSTMSGLITCDIDGDGHPTIFFATEDVKSGLNGTGRVSAISYDGRLLYQTFAWRPCGGGLSIADTNGDGVFELYMGDRHMYMEDGDYGKGIRSFWADNLSERWSYPDILSSSDKPMIADVNGDGIQEIIATRLNGWGATGGVAILDPATGHSIRRDMNLNIPLHYQPTVYDIDGDGNLELIVADGEHDQSVKDIVVFDLVQWKEDARFLNGPNFYAPKVADVTGDGVMDIISCNYSAVIVYDNHYNKIDQVTGLPLGPLNYAVVQDIDGDGYNEVVVSSQDGSVYAYDTPARTPNPKPRTDVQFYSEYRLGAAEYVPPPGCPQPVVMSASPSNGAKDVLLSLNELSFNLIDFQQDPMNYSVTTIPDVGSQSGTNVKNARYHVPLSNLDCSTTYTWNVHATDGVHNTDVSYTFKTGAPAAWWNVQWQSRKAITVDHLKVVSDLQNYPLLVDVTSSDLAAKALPNGNDIAFADSDGNQLPHEIEMYDSGTGHLVAWVRIPLLSASKDTTVFVYYNNPSSPSQQNPSAVWDSNYVTVQHLEETSQNRYDSTLNGNNGRTYGGVYKNTSGKIDGADEFRGSGYVNITGGFMPTNAITVEMWIKPSVNTNYRKFLNTGPTATRGIYGGQQSSSGDSWEFRMSWNNGATTFGVGNIISGYDWMQLTFTWSGSYSYIFRDGSTLREGVASGIPDWAGQGLFLGANYIGTQGFSGTIDEVRVSNVARSSAWIRTSFNNQKTPSAFFTVGNEESLPQDPVISDPSPIGETQGTLTELGFNITDYQGQLINYTVTTSPDIGSGSGINQPSGRYSVPIAGFVRSITYTWVVSVTDGTNNCGDTFTFSYLGTQPTQASPTITGSTQSVNLVCNNQSTFDPDGDSVVNVYNWYLNGKSFANLVLPFNTRDTSVAKDYSGRGNNGKIVGNVVWTSNGRVGGAYQFNSGFIEIPGTTDLDGGGTWSQLTVEHWIYLTEDQYDTRTISKIPSYEVRIGDPTHINRLIVGIWLSDGYHSLWGPALVKNQWYHVVFTYKSGVGITLYLNGANIGQSGALSGNIQLSGSEPLRLGWFDFFRGRIDEVRLYPRCLSAQQINMRYQETRTGVSISSTIAHQEISVGDSWKCEVTPSDSYLDGITKPSSTIVITS